MQVTAVVVGFDKHFSYPKLIKACSYLKNPDCHFVVTNEDSSLPAHSDIMIPGKSRCSLTIVFSALHCPQALGVS